MTRLTDERIASLARQYLGTCKRVFYTKWKDGIDIEYPTLEVEQFARAVIEAELSKQEPVAHGELHPDRARSTARTALGYAQAFDGKGIDWHSDDPWPHRSELAQALDWITDLGAMVLNLADRVPQPLPEPPDTGFAWLIEWNAHGYGPQWWGFKYTPGKRGGWCHDANDAVRFSRRVDAERMRMHVIAVEGLTGQHDYERSVTVTEHAWPRVGAEPPDTVRVPREPTPDMLYAMAELDGWKRGDREHPMLTRWEDYWVAALAAAPKSTP